MRKSNLSLHRGVLFECKSASRTGVPNRRWGSCVCPLFLSISSLHSICVACPISRFLCLLLHNLRHHLSFRMTFVAIVNPFLFGLGSRLALRTGDVLKRSFPLWEMFAGWDLVIWEGLLVLPSFGLGIKVRTSLMLWIRVVCAVWTCW